MDESGKPYKFPLVPRRFYLYNFSYYSAIAGGIILIACLLLWYFSVLYLGMDHGASPVVFSKDILAKYPNYFFIAIGLGLMLVGYSYPLMALMFKKPKFDPWIWELAEARTGTTIAAYDSEKLYLEFDRKLRPNDIDDFRMELNDKSKNYTYYRGYTDINNAQFSIIPVEKEDIPEVANFDPTTDTAWGIVPLGKAVNNRTKTISDYTWKMNDETKRPDIYDTIKSMSLLISGGTGSGKSVLQQAIVGHMSRHADHIQTIGIDVKMVEFINFEKVESFKRIALTVSDAEKCIKATQNFMYKRYATMKENRVNDIYKLRGKEVPYYEFLGEKYQFDELVPVRKDGEFEILQMEEIFEELKKGVKIELLKVVD